MLTFAVSCAFTGSIDGFLALCSCLLELAVLTTRTVSVTVKRGEWCECMWLKQLLISLVQLIHLMYDDHVLIVSVRTHTCTSHHVWICSQVCSTGRHWGGVALGRTLLLPPLWSSHRPYCFSPWSTKEPFGAMTFLWRSCCSWRNAVWGKGKYIG